MLQARFAFLILLSAFAAGCERKSSVSTLERTALIKTAVPTVEKPIFKLTPAAVSRLQLAIDEAERDSIMRLRMELEPGGCTGFRTKLWLDDVLTPQQDACFHVGPIACVYLKKQEFLIQGALIDWIETEEEKGFKVTFPDRSKENQDSTSKWITREFNQEISENTQE